MVAPTATTSIEIETSLLERLRTRHPGRSDRELIEDLAHIDLGFGLLRQAQERNALSEHDAVELGVRAAHESRAAR